MAFNTPLTIPNTLTLGCGTGYFAPFDANNRPLGQLDLGELTDCVLNGTSNNVKFISKRSAVAVVVSSAITDVEFGGSFTSRSMSDENLALFFAGTASTVSQTGATVSAERIYNAQSNRHYQIGVSSTNLTGVRNVTSVTVYLHELKNATARVDSTVYVKGDIYKSSTNVFLVTVGGTSAGSAPSFVTTSVGASTTDGGVTVKYLGTTAAFTLTTDYILSAEAARVGIVSTGAIAAACNLYESVMPGSYLSLSVGYTNDDIEMTDVRSSNAGALTGQFTFISDNAEGPNRTMFIPKCTLRPSGDVGFLSDDYAEIAFEFGVSQLDSGTPQVLINGRPVSV